MKTARNTDISDCASWRNLLRSRTGAPAQYGIRKAGKQEQPEDAMAQWKKHRNLCFLRLLLFQDQTCTMRPLFAPLPIRLEQKDAKATKSEIAA